MRVLIISPTPTHPTDQGNRVRVLQIGSSFKKIGAHVDFLYYNLDDSDPKYIEEMKNVWDSLYIVKPDTGRFRRSMPNAWGVDDWITANLIEAVSFLEKTIKYDIVLVNYVWCSLLLKIFPDNVIKVIDTHDAFGDRHEITRKSGMDPHWFYTTIEQEALGLDRADTVIAIQEQEGEYFNSITKSKVNVIEYAPIPNFLPPRSGKRVTFGYIGSGNPWNIHSVETFDKMLSEKIDRIPYSIRPEFLLFGGITKKLTKLNVFKSIGVVSNVIDAYSSMDVAVNPMIGGTGLKIKTVEALSFGLPVITTKSGGAGIETISSNFICNDIEEMTIKTIDLSLNPNNVLSLSQEMQTGYLEYFDGLQNKIDALINQWHAQLE